MANNTLTIIGQCNPEVKVNVSLKTLRGTRMQLVLTVSGDVLLAYHVIHHKYIPVPNFRRVGTVLLGFKRVSSSTRL